MNRWRIHCILKETIEDFFGGILEVNHGRISGKSPKKILNESLEKFLHKLLTNFRENQWRNFWRLPCKDPHRNLWTNDLGKILEEIPWRIFWENPWSFFWFRCENLLRIVKNFFSERSCGGVAKESWTKYFEIPRVHETILERILEGWIRAGVTKEFFRWILQKTF